MTTKQKRITSAFVGFALTYLGYNYLSNFDANSAELLVNFTRKFFDQVIVDKYRLSMIWLYAMGIVSFCKLLDIGKSELYGVWCVILAIFYAIERLIKNIFKIKQS